jgi:hypothetical protein
MLGLKHAHLHKVLFYLLFGFLSVVPLLAKWRTVHEHHSDSFRTVLGNGDLFLIGGIIALTGVVDLVYCFARKKKDFTSAGTSFAIFFLVLGLAAWAFTTLAYADAAKQQSPGTYAGPAVQPVTNRNADPDINRRIEGKSQQSDPISAVEPSKQQDESDAENVGHDSFFMFWFTFSIGLLCSMYSVDD